MLIQNKRVADIAVDSTGHCTAGSAVENSPAVQETWAGGAGDVGVRKGPWSRKWQPTPVFLPAKIPIHRVAKESDTTG